MTQEGYLIMVVGDSVPDITYVDEEDVMPMVVVKETFFELFDYLARNIDDSPNRANYNLIIRILPWLEVQRTDIMRLILLSRDIPMTIVVDNESQLDISYDSYVTPIRLVSISDVVRFYETIKLGPYPLTILITPKPL